MSNLNPTIVMAAAASRALQFAPPATQPPPADAPPLPRRASQSNPASYVSQISDEQPMRVTKDSEVRLRIMGTRVDATEIFAIGTIKDEYLGLLQPS